MSLRRSWNRFWFGRISAAPLGLFRLVFGLLVAAYGLLLFPDRDVWFSDRGVLTAAAAIRYNAYFHLAPRLNLLPALDDRWLTAVFVAFVLVALCLAAGLWTRAAALGVYLGLMALHNRAEIITNGSDTVMIVMAGYLVLAPAGAACSLDRLRRVLSGKGGKRAPRIVPWAQRLMQVQVSLIYLSALLAKLSGSEWRDGTALYYAMRRHDTTLLALPLTDADHMVLVNLLTYGTLVAEFALAVLIWNPHLRLYVLAAGVAMHVGIECSMNVPMFSFMMIAAYMSFLTRADLEYLLVWLSRPLAPYRLQIAYDGNCGFCRSAVLVFRFLDGLRLVRLQDYYEASNMEGIPSIRSNRATQTALVVATDARGRIRADVAALRALAWRLPGAWPLAPLLYLPGIGCAFRWVASNHSRLPVAPACVAEACETIDSSGQITVVVSLHGPEKSRGLREG